METTFTEWFSRSVRIGSYPSIRDLEPGWHLHDKFDVFINVSDEHQQDFADFLKMVGSSYYWFPLGENMGMSPSSLFGAMNILWNCEQQQQRVYLHCHAGANRSQVAADCYHFMRTGAHRPAPFVIVGQPHDKANQLQKNCEWGHLPPLPKMEAWLKQLAYAVTVPMGGWMDAAREQAGWVSTYEHLNHDRI